MIICLAGIETSAEHLETVLRLKCQHLLFSFFYAGWKRRTLPALLRSSLQQASFRLVDSGAHTFRTVGIGGGDASLSGTVDIDFFIQAYIRWLHQMRAKRLIDWWVELDIGFMVGQKWVDDHRKKFIGAGLGHGLIQVWHSAEHDWDYWLFLLREACRPGRSRYVAIEGNNASQRRPLEYSKFIREAYGRGVRIHGFKMTTPSDLQQHPFYSVDSTTWLTPVHAGAAPVLVRSGGAAQGRADAKQQRSVMNGRRKLWQGTIPRRQTRLWRRDILLVSAQAWLRAERHLDEFWQARGVDWETALKAPEIKDDE